METSSNASNQTNEDPADAPVVVPKSKKTEKLDYYKDYYQKNKQTRNHQRLQTYYKNRYTPEQRVLLKLLKPTKANTIPE